MKECDYCGRENEDEAVFCRECGTDAFKNWPGRAEAGPHRMGVFESIMNWAAALDELASCKEVLISWVMAAWIFMVWYRLLRPDLAQAAMYVGVRMRWYQEVLIPLVVGGTFLLAPLIGTYNLVRWLRQGQKHTLLNLMAWVLLAFFVSTFGLVWIGLWDIARGQWLGG